MWNIVQMKIDRGEWMAKNVEYWSDENWRGRINVYKRGILSNENWQGRMNGQKCGILITC